MHSFLLNIEIVLGTGQALLGVGGSIVNSKIFFIISLYEYKEEPW